MPSLQGGVGINFGNGQGKVSRARRQHEQKTQYLKAVPPMRRASPLEKKLEGPDHGGLFCLVKGFVLHPEGVVEPFRVCNRDMAIFMLLTDYSAERKMNLWEANWRF